MGEMVLKVVVGPSVCEGWPLVRKLLKWAGGGCGDIPGDNGFAPLPSEGAAELE